ncbi:ankyrin repeat domain-containing protein [Pontiella agarivorans]|uniref:Ankyrin repeat domain-containing protein n=1 Tax=Pontiella agarivorans TaxID=3038953 RepID=A0ABU5MV99_9BACT|nr:ankyrin repeat domain-containing protein [Pontiella agarivorans]MDZ8118113.1 ankyrin repeat domain-containing protein [Pontiella agarivorans]
MKSIALVLAALLPAAAFAQTSSNAVNTVTQQEVVEAALYGKTDIIKTALEQGFDVNTADPDKRTPLMFAAYNGQTEIVKMLIASGAVIDAQDTTGTTPLMFAASAPSGKDAVMLLLDAGAEINRVDNNEHFTALMWAAAEGQLENVELLLEKGADLALADVDGDTAESFAAKAGHYAVARCLKQAAKDVQTEK